MKISKHISYNESVFSPTAVRKGIKNEPNELELKNMQLLAKKVFEPLRINNYNKPIKINSFFRSKELNDVIGGSLTSQHIRGEAMDIDDNYGGMRNRDMFYFICNYLDFDQLIWEFGNIDNPSWVHVSYKENGNRKKISISYKKNGYTKYKHFKTYVEFDNFKDTL